MYTPYSNCGSFTASPPTVLWHFLSCQVSDSLSGKSQPFQQKCPNFPARPQSSTSHPLKCSPSLLSSLCSLLPQLILSMFHFLLVVAFIITLKSQSIRIGSLSLMFLYRHLSLCMATVTLCNSTTLPFLDDTSCDKVIQYLCLKKNKRKVYSVFYLKFCLQMSSPFQSGNTKQEEVEGCQELPCSLLLSYYKTLRDSEEWQAHAWFVSVTIQTTVWNLLFPVMWVCFQKASFSAETGAAWRAVTGWSTTAECVQP